MRKRPVPGGTLPVCVLPFSKIQLRWNLTQKRLDVTPVLADATNLPFIDAFADIVTLNATLHHCEDMEKVLAEAARLVKPGGLLITGHDQQLSAWRYKGIARLMWNARLWLYKITGKGFHKTNDQQLGFVVEVFPHNHSLGPEIFDGQTGSASFKYRLANMLSGRNPHAAESALSLMCVAIKA